MSLMRTMRRNVLKNVLANAKNPDTDKKFTRLNRYISKAYKLMREGKLFSSK